MVGLDMHALRSTAEHPGQHVMAVHCWPCLLVSYLQPHQTEAQRAAVPHVHAAHLGLPPKTPPHPCPHPTLLTFLLLSLLWP